MIERREDLRFARKARETIGVAGKELRENLQRDITREPRARYTSPMPPAPSEPTISYGPMRAPGPSIGPDYSLVDLVI